MSIGACQPCGTDTVNAGQECFGDTKCRLNLDYKTNICDTEDEACNGEIGGCQECDPEWNGLNKQCIGTIFTCSKYLTYGYKCRQTDFKLCERDGETTRTPTSKSPTSKSPTTKSQKSKPTSGVEKLRPTSIALLLLSAAMVLLN